MKLLNKIINIFSKYELKPLKFPDGYDNIYTYLTINPDKKPDFISIKTDEYFIKKYYNHISDGHYGFSIGTPIIPEWNEILDEILELCIKTDKSFEIQQIKLKFGYICFYVRSEVIEDILDIEILIGENLHDSALIY